MSKTKPASSSTRRRYPRAPVRIKARLSVPGAKGTRFEATLSTSDISVGGIFFESTFFLKPGQLLEVELDLPPNDRKVRARGQIVRMEGGEGKGKPRSGFAVKFTEYLDSSEVVLANYFLSPVLRAFIQDYAKKNAFQADEEYVSHVIDVLAAWELRKSAAGVVDVTLWGDER